MMVGKEYYQAVARNLVPQLLKSSGPGSIVPLPPSPYPPKFKDPYD